MKMGALILLCIINTVVLVSYVKLSSTFYEPFDPYFISFLFSVVSIILGFVISAMIRLPSKIRLCINIGFPSIFSLALIVMCYVVDISVLQGILQAFFKVILMLVLGSMAILFAYGVFRANRTAIIDSGVGLMVLYFIPAFLSVFFEFPITDIWVIVAFFIGYLLLLELTCTSLFFTQVLKNITPNSNLNELVIQRFNMVVNSYLLFILVIFFFCVLITSSVALISSFFVSEGSFSFFSIDLGSLTGLYFFIVLTLISLVLFWLLVPVSKKQSIIQFLRSNKTHDK